MQQNKTNTKRFAHFMKRLIYILLISSLLFAFNSCGGSGEDPIIIPPTPPTLTKDDIVGTWEIYFSRKDISINETPYEGFRDPEMDGFRTKFYKESGTYKFIDYNPVLDIIDQGTYDIDNGHIVFTVTEFNGRDTLYTTRQNVTNIKLSEGLLYVNYSYSINIGSQEYKISDLRRLRNIATAPGAHPNVTKVAVNFDDYVGTWELYDADVYVNGQRNKGMSETWLDKPNITRFKFYYNNQRQKVGENSVYYADKNETITTKPMPVIIVDDVIHLLFNYEVEGNDDGLFLWITERVSYTDPVTNKQTVRIRDEDEFRDKDKPTDIYNIKRFFKKIE